MKIWVKCNVCNHMEHANKLTSVEGKCPECGERNLSVHIDSEPPEWWVEPEKQEGT